MKQCANPVKIGNVRITDALFGSYVKLVAKQVLPYQWEVLNDRISGEERHYCIENFRVASGARQGRHHGAIFQDTDLYKWLEAAAFCIECGFGEHLIPLTDEAVELIRAAKTGAAGVVFGRGWSSTDAPGSYGAHRGLQAQKFHPYCIE